MMLNVAHVLFARTVLHCTVLYCTVLSVMYLGSPVPLATPSVDDRDVPGV